MSEERKIIIGVCKGRHEMPCTDFVFGNTISNVTDVDALEKEAYEKIKNILDREGIGDEEVYGGYKFVDCVSARACEIQLYVTGLTVAVIAAMKAAQMAAKVTLMHYDNATGVYYPQDVTYFQ